MNLRLSGLVAALVMLFATGCASTNGPEAEQEPARTELVYRTGSNIPVREKQTPEEKAKQAEEGQRALQQMQSTGAGKPKL
jgi:hypothetical protein